MSKTTMITARIDPELKRETEKVLKELGLTTSQAITLFFNQISLRKALPFAVAIPNTETAQAIEKALAGVELYEAENVDALTEDPNESFIRRPDVQVFRLGAESGQGGEGQFGGVVAALGGQGLEQD